MNPKDNRILHSLPSMTNLTRLSTSNTPHTARTNRKCRIAQSDMHLSFANGAQHQLSGIDSWRGEGWRRGRDAEGEEGVVRDCYAGWAGGEVGGGEGDVCSLLALSQAPWLIHTLLHIRIITSNIASDTAGGFLPIIRNSSQALLFL